MIQVSAAIAIPGSVVSASVVPPRAVPRPMPMLGMQRMPPAFNIASQAGIGGLNPGGIPIQRGAAPQAHPQQVVFGFGFKFVVLCNHVFIQFACFLFGAVEEKRSCNGNAEYKLPSTEETILA